VNGHGNGNGKAVESEKERKKREGWERERAELCARCLERLSVFRIRDGMGEGLEPVMGLLRSVPSTHILIVQRGGGMGTKLTRLFVRFNEQVDETTAESG